MPTWSAAAIAEEGSEPEAPFWRRGVAIEIEEDEVSRLQLALGISITQPPCSATVLGMERPVASPKTRKTKPEQSSPFLVSPPELVGRAEEVFAPSGVSSFALWRGRGWAGECRPLGAPAGKGKRAAANAAMAG